MDVFTKGKRFCKTSLQVGMDLLKVQKQGRNENMQKDYSTVGTKEIKFPFSSNATTVERPYNK